MSKELTIEEFLELLQEQAIPLQEQKIQLLEKLYELTGEKESDSNVAKSELLNRQIKIIQDKIEEIETKMGIES